MVLFYNPLNEYLIWKHTDRFENVPEMFGHGQPGQSNTTLHFPVRGFIYSTLYILHLSDEWLNIFLQFQSKVFFVLLVIIASPLVIFGLVLSTFKCDRLIIMTDL